MKKYIYHIFTKTLACER